MFNRNNRGRKMKKIFQWEEYLNWKKMTKEQKLNFKRACLFPFLVYIVYVFLNQNYIYEKWEQARPLKI